MTQSSAKEPYAPDPASVAGKQPPIDAETDVLIIGAGPAGLSAALAAARGGGARIMLVDENPVPLATMGADVPLHFGGRMAATLANRNAVLERMLDANPKLAQVMDAGVDVRLGTVAWGLFPQQATAAWIDGHVAGLAEEGRAYLLRFRQVIVAAGRRDMGLSFEGWHHPGVMGASAAYRLAVTYDALDAKVAVLVGSDTDALKIGNVLMDRGVRIAAIVEQSGAVTGSARELTHLMERGARVCTGHVVQQAVADGYGVTAVMLAGVDAAGRRGGGELHRIDCDTVLLGLGAVPAIELLEACGCAVRFQAARGGHVPDIDASQRTSLPCVYAAGDCAGTWAAKSCSEATAVREGRIAGLAALRALGREPADALGARRAAAPADTLDSQFARARLGWVRASVVASPFAPFVCQCEEVTAAEITGLQPPRYLGVTQDATHGARGLASLDDGRPTNPDAVKRLTRAGMGACQGRRCREQIAALVALHTQVALAHVPLATYRTPVRPLALAVLATLPEAPSMHARWDSWFGMAPQWVPFWRACAADEPAAGE